MIIDVAYVTPFNVTEFVIIDLLLFESGSKIILNVCWRNDRSGHGRRLDEMCPIFDQLSRRWLTTLIDFFQWTESKIVPVNSHLHLWNTRNAILVYCGGRTDTDSLLRHEKNKARGLESNFARSMYEELVLEYPSLLQWGGFNRDVKGTILVQSVKGATEEGEF